jgi:hypothetical protein
MLPQYAGFRHSKNLTLKHHSYTHKKTETCSVFKFIFITVAAYALTY